LTQGEQESKLKLRIKSHTPSILQFVLGLFVMLFFLVIAIILFGSGWAIILDQNGESLQAAAAFMSGFGILTAAILLGPSTYFAFHLISEKKLNIPWLFKLNKIIRKRVLFVTVFTLVIGGIVGANAGFSLYALPPIHAIASTLIIYLLLIWAVSGIELGTPQRYWGVLAAGIIFGPFLAIIVEIFLGTIIFLIAVIYIASQSQYAGLLEALSNIDVFNANETFLQESLFPLASDPVIIILVLVFVSLVVPLIEELVKPIGLYFSMGRKWTPASGFALGALSGAGFALFENLLLGVSANAWLPVMVARIGTTSIHLLTSGLIGMALVRARNEKHYGKLITTFILSVGLHGLWNGLAILASFSSFDFSQNLISSNALANGMLLGLFVLAISSIFLLRYNNRRFVATD